MAKSKEYQVKMTVDGNVRPIATFVNYNDALLDFSDNMYHLSWFVTFKQYALVELIQILDNGENIILKSHGYGEIPKEK